MGGIGYLRGNESLSDYYANVGHVLSLCVCMCVESIRHRLTTTDSRLHGKHCQLFKVKGIVKEIHTILSHPQAMTSVLEGRGGILAPLGVEQRLPFVESLLLISILRILVEWRQISEYACHDVTPFRAWLLSVGPTFVGRGLAPLNPQDSPPSKDSPSFEIYILLVITLSSHTITQAHIGTRSRCCTVRRYGYIELLRSRALSKLSDVQIWHRFQ